MAQAGSVLPGWLVVVSSLAIIGHLVAVAAGALAAPSGPWPSPAMLGSAPYAPPYFAAAINQVTMPGYLAYLKLAHTYHFATNNPIMPGIYLEARLRDAQGQVIKTVLLPDPDANPWLRVRQAQLARGLGEDENIQPPASEVIAGPNQPTPMVTIWEPVDQSFQKLVLRTTQQNLLPRDRPVFGPSGWMMVLARSYARHLARTHGAARVELIRHHQEPIQPNILYQDFPAGAFDPVSSNFGELPR
ncbi:MAG: hypothetical protein NZ700_04920 [Gemmataceae bacterium]|nr:hypothetical protein [Gemmataceae bacterium]MDW8267444.1 hypothetical protein [Gemmataceae bacterium]